MYLFDALIVYGKDKVAEERRGRIIFKLLQSGSYCLFSATICPVRDGVHEKAH